DEREGAQGDVDEKDGAPVEMVEEQSGPQGPDGDADAGESGPDADGRCSCLRCGGDDGWTGQARRKDHGGTNTDEDTGDDEADGTGLKRSETGEPSEDDDAEVEQLLSAEAITKRAHHEEQRREDDDVPVDEPLELTSGGSEFAHDARNRQVHAGVPDGGDDQGQTENDEDHPLASSCDALVHAEVMLLDRRPLHAIN